MRPGGRRVGWHFLPLIIAIPALYDVHRTDAVYEVVRVDLAAVGADKAARIAHRTWPHRVMTRAASIHGASVAASGVIDDRQRPYLRSHCDVDQCPGAGDCPVRCLRADQRGGHDNSSHHAQGGRPLHSAAHGHAKLSCSWRVILCPDILSMRTPALDIVLTIRFDIGSALDHFPNEWQRHFI